jgi:hypothetical protein
MNGIKKTAVFSALLLGVVFSNGVLAARYWLDPSNK